jgi:hypothetical protein
VSGIFGFERGWLLMERAFGDLFHKRVSVSFAVGVMRVQTPKLPLQHTEVVTVTHVQQSHITAIRDDSCASLL